MSFLSKIKQFFSPTVMYEVDYFYLLHLHLDLRLELAKWMERDIKSERSQNNINELLLKRIESLEKEVKILREMIVLSEDSNDLTLELVLRLISEKASKGST